MTNSEEQEDRQQRGGVGRILCMNDCISRGKPLYEGLESWGTQSENTYPPMLCREDLRSPQWHPNHRAPPNKLGYRDLEATRMLRSSSLVEERHLSVVLPLFCYSQAGLAEQVRFLVSLRHIGCGACSVNQAFSLGDWESPDHHTLP